MDVSVLAEIDALAARGKIVIAADDDTVLSLVKEAIETEKSVSFYLTPEQAKAVRAWYWTSARIKARGLAKVSDEELEKIYSELGIADLGTFRFTPTVCPCGHTYGAFEFFQQGINEHGVDTVNAVLSAKNTKLFQVNPRFTPLCPSCGQKPLRDDGGIEYEGDTYGGCSCCAAALE
ncbi:hypothetical protein LO762_21585 [Actinocorallia sp. API 0066]|uniref:hypothetical protein n=1 Tax=Actinocorallia sp. API 0066 TaxID=2896846 RepID=UPI001E4D2C89|nr:hypothetical protein [Actinocorallia sp. API 0066]MCD0451766.1 hypothetical protein [Actinocorallia sp. API 0066]